MRGGCAKRKIEQPIKIYHPIKKLSNRNRSQFQEDEGLKSEVI
jgi:hypothetical protein